MLTTGRTRPFIFNALATLALPERSDDVARGALARLGREAFLRDFGVTVWPAPLTEDDLGWFRARHSGDVGQMRRKTCSGRVWREVQHHEQTIAVFSFWVPTNAVPAGTLPMLCERFGLDGSSPVYVECMDSFHPDLFTPRG